MKPVEVYFGFWRPALIVNGKLTPSSALGHCEAWFYTQDDTWVFLDLQRKGFRVFCTHLHDEVESLMEDRFAGCQSVLKMPYSEPVARVPFIGLMTCAALCGVLVGIRALTPWGLRRRLLAEGAEVIYENPEGRSGRQGGPAPRT